MRSNEALLQYLVAIAVQIRHGVKTDQVVGTGVVVSADGKIATCAHVVRDAGVDPTTGKGLAGLFGTVFGASQPTQGEVGIYFEPVPGVRLAMERRARVWRSFPNTKDDVVVLELAGDPPNLTAREVAVLGRSEPSFGNSFWSLGFPELPTTVSHSANGVIHHTEAEPFEGCLIGRVELNSDRIQKGMSGAPVLDTERNLVVGLISDIWDAEGDAQNRDAAWGVNARVLGLEPIGLLIQEENLPLGEAPRSQIAAPKIHVPEDRTVPAWNGAFAQQPHFVGRRTELAALSREWRDERVRVSVWTGRAGEGKSALVRKWVEEVSSDTEPRPPKGIFWWTFGQSDSVDQFFDQALLYLTQGKLLPRSIGTLSERAHMLGALLYAGEYVLVLDGLEAVQHPDGGMAGYVSHPDLALFLTLCASPQHESFTVVTSRLMVSDLVNYAPRIVSRHQLAALNDQEVRDLVTELAGSATAHVDTAIARAAHNALTLTLQTPAVLSGVPLINLADERGGTETDASRADELQVTLRAFDQRLAPRERAVLLIASLLRVPLDRAALDAAAMTPRRDSVVRDLSALDSAARDELLTDMVRRLLLNFDGESRTFSIHSELRAYYLEELRERPVLSGELHARLFEHFMKSGGTEIPDDATLENLRPFIEAVHHGVRGGRQDEAFVAYASLALPPRSLLFHRFGAVETDLALVREFFPGGDLDAEPVVAEPVHRIWLLNEAGVCMAALGNLPQAIAYLDRSVKLARRESTWMEAATSGTNLAIMYALTGSLSDAVNRIIQAYRDGRRTDDVTVRRQSLAARGWITSLLGRGDIGLRLFERADRLAREDGEDGVPLEGTLGLRHAELLFRSQRTAEGTALARDLLTFASRERRLPMISIAKRVLAEWDSTLQQNERAAYLDEAVRLARLVRRQEALIEALMARGRLQAASGDERAVKDLEEALSASRAGGYRILQADVQFALAEWYAKRDDGTAARNQQAEAARLVRDTGYRPPQSSKGVV